MKQLFYGLIYKSLSNNSYNDVTNTNNNKNIEDGIHNKMFTSEALIIKKNKIDSKHFLSLNDSLINSIYNNDKERLLAVDDTTLNLSKKFNSNGFKFASNNETYCKGYLSCLMDVNNKIPINYNLSLNNNERNQ